MRKGDTSGSVRGHWRLQVAFAFHGAVHGRVFLVDVSDKFQRLAPVVFVGHVIK